MKTKYNQLQVVTWYLTSTVHNLGPTAVHNFGSLPVEMEGCEEMWFKQHAIHWVLDCGKICRIHIHYHIQTVYEDKYVGLSTVRHCAQQLEQKEVGRVS